jgi:hypothetical protein
VSDEDRERTRLRAERERLHRQIARLVVESVRLKGSTDMNDISRYSEDVETHKREFHVFRTDLALFRRRYGPLGE